MANVNTNGLQACMILTLSFGAPCFVRKVAKSKLDIRSTEDGEEVNRDRLMTSVKIFESETYDRILADDNATRAAVLKLSQPREILASPEDGEKGAKKKLAARGTMILSVEGARRAYALIKERRAERALQIESFLAEYDLRRAQERVTLGPLFDEGDFPPVAYLRSSFYIHAAFTPFGAPEALKTISEALYEEENRRIAESAEQTALEIQYAMRTAFEALVGGLRDVLAGEREGGKPKILKDSRVENLREWISLFDVRNVVADGRLGNLVEAAKGLLEGKSGEDLREDPDLRKRTAQALATIEREARTLAVADKPKRLFDFDE